MAKLNTTLALSSATLVDGILKLDTSLETDLSFSDTSSDTATITHGAAIEIIATGGADKYIYIKNTDAINYVELQISAGTHYGTVHPGDFVFYCVKAGAGLKLQANTGDCIVDYMFFSKS